MKKERGRAPRPDAQVIKPSTLGTDIGALRAGYVSVTPLSFAVELGDLSPGCQSFIARLTKTFPLGTGHRTA